MSHQRIEEVLCDGAWVERDKSKLKSFPAHALLRNASLSEGHDRGGFSVEN